VVLSNGTLFSKHLVQ